MKFVRATSWKEIFAGWKLREANDPGWIKCATEVKGWPDWESWRRFTAQQIGAEKLYWEIQEFSDSMNEISEMLIGPYSGWQARATEKNKNSFNDLVSIPEQFDYWKNVNKINSIIENFPSSAQMIGLIRDDNNKIVCIEGHHRATAVAVAKKLGKEINFKTPVQIAVAHISADQVDMFDRVLARGTSKEN